MSNRYQIDQRYAASPKGLSRYERYNASPKGLARKRRYQSSPKGLEVHRINQRNRRNGEDKD